MEESLDNFSDKEKDDFFIHVCYRTIQERITVAIIPLIFFIIYISIRLIARGNAVLFYVTYKQILFYAIASIVVIFIYGFSIISHLSAFINKKIILTLRSSIAAMVEGLSQAFLYAVSAFLVYCIVFIGIKSLFDLKYGFSIYPFIKLLIFALGGIYALLPIFHLLKLGKLLSEKKVLVVSKNLRVLLQTEILQYIFQKSCLK